MKIEPETTPALIDLSSRESKIKKPAFPAISLIATIFVVLYLIAFGLADEKYHQQSDNLEERISSLWGSANDMDVQKLVHDISTLQNTKVPVKPSILNPISVFKSSLRYFDSHKDRHNLLVKVLNEKKEELNNITISDVRFDPSFSRLPYEDKATSFNLSKLRNLFFSKLNPRYSNFESSIVENTLFLQYLNLMNKLLRFQLFLLGVGGLF